MGHLNFFVGNESVLDDVFSRLEKEKQIVSEQRRGGPLIAGGCWALRLRYHGDIRAVSLEYNDAFGKADFYEPLENGNCSLMYAGEQGCLGRQVMTLKTMDNPLAKRLLERPLHTGEVETYQSIAEQTRVDQDAFSSITRNIQLDRDNLNQSYDFINGLMAGAEWYRRRQNFIVTSYQILVRP